MDPATILMNPDATFDGQFSRIQLVIKATTLSEFAGFFGIHPSAIGAARRRGSETRSGREGSGGRNKAGIDAKFVKAENPPWRS